jgi:hypothetical protein
LHHPKSDKLTSSFKNEGWGAQTLTWEQLAFELDFGVSGDTMKRAFGSLEYYKCIACKKDWLSQRCVNRELGTQKLHFA